MSEHPTKEKGRWFGAPKMGLFCVACGSVHVFDFGEVERLVYTLDGIAREAVTAIAEEEAEANCLNEVLRASFDPDGYAEYVAASIVGRETTDSQERPE